MSGKGPFSVQHPPAKRGKVVPYRLVAVRTGDQLTKMAYGPFAVGLA